MSRLARALWIEILQSLEDAEITTSRLARALWIEIISKYLASYDSMSRLARALWIEILPKFYFPLNLQVEARESRVV